MLNGVNIDCKIQLKKSSFFFLDFDDYLLRDGIMGNLEIFVKEIESCK
jgi:hypothetical protein